jgi:uncharacterized membrane protein
MDTLHPLAIHMPLALIFLWPLVDGLGLKLNSPHLMRLGLAMLGAAVLFALFATATGQAAFEAAVEAGVEPKLLRTHTDDADRVPWILLAVLGARAWLPKKLGHRGHAFALLLGLLVWPVAFGVGRTGGALVYEHGVGVWKSAIDGGAAKR